MTQAERLLCERDVLNMLGWPSRKFLNIRMREDGFPKPCASYVAVGDQWRESEILQWVNGGPMGETGFEKAMKRFAIP